MKPGEIKQRAWLQSARDAIRDNCWLHQVSPKGHGPGRRSEHSAAAVDGTIFVIGGRSTTCEFKDMYALDTELDPPVWTEVSALIVLLLIVELSNPRNSVVAVLRVDYVAACVTIAQ